MTLLLVSNLGHTFGSVRDAALPVFPARTSICTELLGHSVLTVQLPESCLSLWITTLWKHYMLQNGMFWMFCKEQGGHSL